jgi:ADP-ribose pyrophosphatase YjhB (NUDIX family)
MSHPSVYVAALVLRGDGFLMLRTGADWQLPNASVQLGETLAEAVVRILAEQAGLQGAICGPFIGWAESVEALPPDTHRVTMYFQAVTLGHETEPKSVRAEVRWIPAWDAAELGLADGLAEFLSEHGYIDTLV